MAISRMQNPRQMYGLGSLVKSIKKGIKTGIKGVTKTVKKNPLLSLAALNFAPMLGGGAPFIGFGNKFAGGKFAGQLGNIPSLSSLFAGGTKKAGEKTLGGTLAAFAGGSLLGGLLNEAEEEGDPEGITRNVGALRAKLTNAYKNQRTFAKSENEDAAIANQVEIDLSEYNQDMARGMANGGRIQYGLGSLVSASMQAQPGRNPGVRSSGMGGMIAKLLNNNPNILEKLKISNSNSSNFIDENFNGIDDRQEAAYGGRMGFARGPNNPEQNALAASLIEGLPLNKNPAGVTELDLRETGGFIPPVGVKEKADDIPAMLANNEFVMTADAVKEFGDGDVNKGAQRMYDMMKQLEKNGRA
jgi:hypothetical protein